MSVLYGPKRSDVGEQSMMVFALHEQGCWRSKPQELALHLSRWYYILSPFFLYLLQ